MMADSGSSMVHVRIDDRLKADATAALDAIGLSTSDAVRLLFHRIVADQAFPLELKVPNAETRAAMDHPLKGEWAGYRECHVGGDFLLIYEVDDAAGKSGGVTFVRAGTHSELFQE